MSCIKCERRAKDCCARCKTAYCSQQCQTQDWGKHKQVCEMVGQIIALVNAGAKRKRDEDKLVMRDDRPQRRRVDDPRAFIRRLIEMQPDVAEALLTDTLNVEVLVWLTIADARVVNFLTRRGAFERIFGNMQTHGEIVQMYINRDNDRDFLNDLFVFANDNALQFLALRLSRDPRVDV